MNSIGRTRTAQLEDGRRVVATQPSPLAPWTVVVDGEVVVTMRWLLSALAKALVGPGRAPDWVMKLTDEFQGVDTPLGRRFPCPCCDLAALQSRDSHYTCPVCAWEDDLVQFRDPDYRGGANKPSLREARENYKRFGASSERRLAHVRPPLAEEPNIWEG